MTSKLTATIQISIGELNAIIDWHISLIIHNTRIIKDFPYDTKIESWRKLIAERKDRIRELNNIKDDTWPK